MTEQQKLDRALKLKNLKALVKAGLGKDEIFMTNFADGNDAVIKGLAEYYGVDLELDVRKFRDLDFNIIAEMIDELLPERLQRILGDVVEMKTFARNEEVKFILKDLGKRRALMGIQRGARAGIYKAHRLDSKEFSISTEVWTAGVNVTLENILLGEITLGELFENIMQGFEYRVWLETVRALRTVKTLAPSANVSAGDGIDTAEIDGIVRVVKAYGPTTIMCFPSFAANFTNGTNNGFTPSVPASDLDEIKTQGYVGVYKGTKVVVLPNFIVDENTNDKWVFGEADCFILPSGAKPILLAYQGEGYIQNIDQNLGGKEMHYHRIMGIGLTVCNNIGIYTDSSIEKSETGNYLA